MSDVAQLGLSVDSTQVVAGKTALDQLTTSGGKAETAVTALGKSSATASVAQKALDSSIKGVSNQLTALSAGAGPVGTFLAGLGPWGLLAAAGLGAIGVAFSYVREEAARMGGKAVELNAFRAATDLTIAQISALKQAGAQFGVTGDTIQTSFERLTAQLQDARRATGPLYDDVQKIDGALAKQLENARSTAEGIDVLAKAYNAAGDASAKLDLARSIFGRGGAVIGPLLGKINDSGGLVKLAEQLKNVGDQSDDVTAQWAQMQAQIDQSNKRAQNILASIFTPEGLALSLKAAETMERFATAAKYAADLRKQSSGSGFLSFLGEAANASDPQSSIESGARERDAAYAAKAAADGWAEYDRAIAASVTPSKNAATSQEKLAKSTKEAQDAAAAASKTQQDLMTFLGSGATIADRLATRLKDIKAAYLDNRTGGASKAEADSLRARAEGAAQLDSLIQKESLRIGVLGAQATVQDAVIEKQLAINKANQQGAGITSTQAKAVLAYTAAQALGTLAIRQQTSAAEIEAGAVDKGVGAAAAFRAEQEKLADFRLRGINLTDDQVAALHREADALGKATQKAAERKALSDALFEGSQFGRTDTEARVAATLRQLYGSDFQAQQEGAIANQIRFNETLKSTKAFGEDALSGFLRDVRDGKSATEALQGVLIKLENKMFDIASNQLMSALLGGTTGGGSGGLLGSLLKGFGGGASGNVASTGSNSGFAIGGAHEGAIVGMEATFARMFGGARRHHTGTGNVGIDEVPIIAKRGEGVFTEGQMRKLAPVGQGGGGPIQVNIMNAPAGTGAEVKQTPQPGGGMRIDIALKRMIEDQVGASLRSGQGPIHDALNQDYGVSKRLT